MRAICESRNTTGIGTGGSTLLVAKELANSKLCQQEDSEALEGTLEARLERGQYKDKIETSNTYVGLLLSARPLFRHIVAKYLIS
jgi:hypothetical protein